MLLLCRILVDDDEYCVELYNFEDISEKRDRVRTAPHPSHTLTHMHLSKNSYLPWAAHRFEEDCRKARSTPIHRHTRAHIHTHIPKSRHSSAHSHKVIVNNFDTFLNPAGSKLQAVRSCILKVCLVSFLFIWFSGI